MAKEIAKKITTKTFFEKIAQFENTVYQITMTNKFKKSIDLSYSRNLNLQLLLDVVELLAQDKKLPEKYCAHELKGHYKGVWECHIKPDWLLMWEEDKKELVLLLLNTATHSDFVGKKY
ncbi:MAG: type II toxin-antitoxin system YafQ family toxin [Prevotellaceae bacterium]|jgi:mRNA interferase YafQ|nr:type II toxin-antitoxin system YafQ family toxin [Prevotellaceae bacterium]